MISFIAEHRDDLGVEPICKVLPIAQSTFYAHAAIARDPDLASDRAKRDAVLVPEIARVWEENNEVYGIRKVWHQAVQFNPANNQNPLSPVINGTSSKLSLV